MDKTHEYRWIERIVMAGLRTVGENQEGERLATFADLYAEHDRVMNMIIDNVVNEGRDDTELM
tara:strand:- start:2308 stop:2496 length:189 start_codon:yes stop_codon:yes gene_type:complete